MQMEVITLSDGILKQSGKNIIHEKQIQIQDHIPRKFDHSIFGGKWQYEKSKKYSIGLIVNGAVSTEEVDCSDIQNFEQFLRCAQISVDFQNAAVVNFQNFRPFNSWNNALFLSIKPFIIFDQCVKLYVAMCENHDNVWKPRVTGNFSFYLWWW